MNSINENESNRFANTSVKKVDQLFVFFMNQWQVLLLVVLFIAVVFVSIKTVVQRHESRLAYMELQSHEKERDKLVAQWSRLKLEQATTLNQVRVEQYARWDLGMKIPKASEVKIIQEKEDVLAESMNASSESVNQSKVAMDN